MWRWAIGLLVLASSAHATCAPDVVSLRQDGLNVDVTVEIMDDAAERAQGMMFREDLAPFAGMLFVYDRPQPVAFWMKNTLIPLDMIFMDATGTVARIHANAIPGDLTAIPGGNEIQFVLEVNGGFAQMLGLRPGAQMRHASVDPAQAVWPCE